VQRGDIVFPKSVKRERMIENFSLFDFSLTPDDMVEISALNRNERTGSDPDTNNWIPS
jgi:2,5-diketo-D-gluconate reductase A